MKTYTVFGAIAVITAGIVGFVLWEDSRARERLTLEAEPVGLVATEVEWDEGDDDGRRRGHTLTFAWVDHRDSVHTETLQRITWYDPAQEYKVCYNPEDPTDRRVYRRTVRCG